MLKKYSLILLPFLIAFSYLSIFSNNNSTIQKTYTIYVDDLGSPSASFNATATSNQTSLAYNCGIPSVKTFQIVPNQIQDNS